MKRTFIFLTALAFSLIFVACDKKPNPVSKRIKTAPVKVKIQVVKSDNVTNRHSFTGNIEGDKKVKLSTKLMGEITFLNVQEGSKVRRGQTLIKIRNKDMATKKSQIAANFSEANAVFKNADMGYKRMQSLYASKSAPKHELDNAEMAYNRAKSQIELLKHKEAELDEVLSYSTLRSPINGHVVRKMYEKGDIASPGMPLLIIEDMNKLNVIAKVPESQVLLFKEGDTVKIKVDALVGKEFDGEILHLNPAGNAMSREFSVKIRIKKDKDTPDELKSGMYAKIVLEKGETELVKAEKKWLIKKGQLTGLYVITDDNRAILRWIRVGRTCEDSVEVVSGLKPGEKVVTEGMDKLKDLAKVEVLK